VTYSQVSADATRTAALLSGEVDFVLDPPPQDLRRMEEGKTVKVVRGQENGSSSSASTRAATNCCTPA